MQLGEIIATYDVALALRGEVGKFDVTSPVGETYHVTCKPDHSISSLEWSGNPTDSQPFLIRKVAEPVPQEQGKAGALAIGDSALLSRKSRAPLLLENQEGAAPSNADVVSLPPESVEDESQVSGTLALDLLYVECGPETKLPSACICIKDKQENFGNLMTAPCGTFNEFDAEIRRLHSQLDEIRYRARKKFYQATQLFAAGA